MLYVSCGQQLAHSVMKISQSHVLDSVTLVLSKGYAVLQVSRVQYASTRVEQRIGVQHEKTTVDIIEKRGRSRSTELHSRERKTHLNIYTHIPCYLDSIVHRNKTQSQVVYKRCKERGSWKLVTGYFIMMYDGRQT